MGGLGICLHTEFFLYLCSSCVVIVTGSVEGGVLKKIMTGTVRELVSSNKMT